MGIYTRQVKEFRFGEHDRELRTLLGRTYRVPELELNEQQTAKMKKKTSLLKS